MRIFRVEILYFVEFLVQKIAYDSFRVLGRIVAPEVRIEYFRRLFQRQRRNVRCVFDGLPYSVASRIVGLIFDNDELSFFIERQNVKPFVRLIPTRKLLLNN